MASDRGKWSNYVHICISGTYGTYGVEATPFWAGIHAVDPGQCGQPLRNQTERSHITSNYFCLIRLLLVFRFFKMVASEINGRFEKLH